MRMKISGLILAGGQGRRMGGTDKGLVSFHQEPFIAHVLRRLAPQVDEILINANQNLETYQSFGYPVISDAIMGFAGPLAGLERGLALSGHEWVLTVPVDSPFLPHDLAGRLAHAVETEQAEIAIAKTHERTHPVFCLCPKKLHASLLIYLESGGRKIDGWFANHHVATVSFDDNAEAFTNINTLNELHILENNVPFKEIP
ncbi:MAG: molybdenum cofactor guanylyltransferase [Pseudomonadota bacterium]|nr:molybdenum cofactor guanylyltransferase [Pseudomonadota bacterium]